MGANFIFGVGYLFFGMLIGYLTGITSTEITHTILTALFSFLGGKLFIDAGKKDDTYKKQAGIILICFSIAFFLGFNGGIYVKVNKLFTPAEFRKEMIKEDVKKDNPYVRHGMIEDTTISNAAKPR